MRVAVTGAAGLVGFNLCRLLLEKGFEVSVLVHRDDRALRLLNVKTYHGDLLKPQTLAAFLKDAEVVFHAAAKISIHGDPEGLVSRANVAGTHNMIKASLKAHVKRFIHFSSIEVFRSDPRYIVLDEDRAKISTGSAYAMTKLKAEQEVLKANIKGFETLVLNPTAIIGPFDFKPSLIGKFLLDLYKARLPALLAGGFDWVDVRDIAAAAISAISNGMAGEQYILAGRWASFQELASMAEKVTGHAIPRTTLPISCAYAGLPIIKAMSRLRGMKPLYTSESLSVIKHSPQKVSSKKAEDGLNSKVRPLQETLTDTYAWFKSAQFL